MIFGSQQELRDHIESLLGRRCSGAITVLESTTRYMDILPGMVLRLDGNDYFVTGDAREGRFGLDEQPKFWVKYAMDLSDGSRKIVKLVFHEEFHAQLGAFKVRCVRDPDKEGRVLELVKQHPRFMHGKAVRDAAGNNVRIIDMIKGRSLYTAVDAIRQDHEEYYCLTLPGLLDEVAECIEALEYLHRRGEQHGDIRNDHILIDSSTGLYRWIDFDYSVNFIDYDIWSVGNILNHVVGRGTWTCKQAIQTLSDLGTRSVTIGPDDALLFFPHRLANLRKLFPHIGSDLNELLMRFSLSTMHFYEDFATIARDLRAVIPRTSRSIGER
jgi:hypothetical protein